MPASQVHAAFLAYKAAIEKDFQKGIATEHTYRPALKKLLESLGPAIEAVNEPRRVECGAPDFVLFRKQTKLGNVETKDVGADLDPVEREPQLARYRKGLPNLVLTDYLEFRWYVRGEHRLTARLATPDAKHKLRLEPNGVEEVSRLLRGFIEIEVPTISSPKELAQRMGAGVAQLIRHAITRALAREEEGGTLHEQLKGFQKVLLHGLEKEQFADMYAQTICYGLFAARCNTKPGERFTRETAAFLLPKTNPFLRKMFTHIAGPELDDRIVWAVEDLVDLLNHAQIHTILEDFGKRTRQEDPVVHFYETFLAAYDPKMREARGVYYTPEPVVSYIVRSVDHILKTDFGLSAGLADASKLKIKRKDHKGKQKVEEVHRVLILDPAAGTGTFLHGVIDQIYEHLVASGQKGAWSEYVSKHLLPRLFGFELLMAPYAVAHMKLGLQLGELGYDFREGERLGIYLTNTLEEAHAEAGLPLFAKEIADEANAASRIKRDLPIMVVLGNPPYSGLSANMSSRISALVEPYKSVDGLPLAERKHWLQDDYVKFVRFAQSKIESTGSGILGFITNHGYLSNPTFRGMRRSLMQTFDEIYVIDLHGNTKKKERSPDGSRDQNVFDIQQGVSIGLFVKKGRNPQIRVTVKHHELWGPREVMGGDELCSGKYRWLLNEDVASTPWKELHPDSPFYFFVPQSRGLRQEYEQAVSVAQLLPVNVAGIVTARDSFVTDFSAESLLARIEELRSDISDEALRLKYFEGKGSPKYPTGDTRGWKLPVARTKIREDLSWRNRLIDYLHRPFDIRRLYYVPWMVDWPRPEVMKHMLDGKNLALCTTRSVEIGRGFEHVLCTRSTIQHHSVSMKEVNYLFPLRLEDGGGTLFENETNRASSNLNLAAEHLSILERQLHWKFDPNSGDLQRTFGPEDVFHYIYAILHSPTYRSRYAEFLKIDFPRIPLTSDRELFRTLCALGKELVELHLLESPRLNQVITSYPVSGDHLVAKGFPKYLAPGLPEPGSGKPLAAGRVYINAPTKASLAGGQYFEGVPPEVWEFHIGGYQVCEKWLKDRRERHLTWDDIQHYQKVVTALAETRRLMAAIDAAITSWPIQ